MAERPNALALRGLSLEKKALGKKPGKENGKEFSRTHASESPKGHTGSNPVAGVSYLSCMQDVFKTEKIAVN